MAKECLGPMFDNVYSKAKKLSNVSDRMTYLDTNPSTVKSYRSALVKDKVNIMISMKILHVVKA